MRTAAWLLRLKRQLYARITDKPIGNDLLADYIDANEYDAALLALICLVQRQEFGGLVKALEHHPYHKIESGECGENLKRLMKSIMKYCPFVEGDSSHWRAFATFERVLRCKSEQMPLF